VTPAEYLQAIQDRLLLDPLIANFHILRERETAIDGYLRVKTTLINGSLFEFAEYFQHTPEGEIHVVTYTYHWATADATLIMRWDNTPHFPALPNFPHHIHDGNSGIVQPGQEMNIFAVLDEIARLFRHFQ